MELRQLRYFVHVAELLNFTQAARQLHISQSTLSQQIMQLEHELGTPLLDRLGRRVALTEAGRRFRSYAMQAVASAEGGRQVIRDLANLETGALAVGATYALRSRLSGALIQFASSHPGIALGVSFGTSDDLVTKLRAGALDFVMTFQQGPRDTDLDYQPLFRSRLALVVAAGSPLAGRAEIALGELALLDLALPVRGFSTRQFLDAALAGQQIAPHIQIEINDIPTLLHLVRTGRWCTILTMATVEGEPGVRAIPLAGGDMERQAWVLRQRHSYQTQAAARFCALLMGAG